jgi:hypothetical protein
MLVATFNEATGWAGRSITFVAGSFLLEGHGVVTATDVAAYDALGQLTWARGDLRDWVLRSSATDAARQSVGAVWRGGGRHRALPAWAVVLLVVGILVGCSVVAAIVVPMVALQRQTARGGTTTYTNAAGGYRIYYPASYSRRPYVSGAGDPDLSIRLFEPGLSPFVRGELSTTVIVAVQRMDYTPTRDQIDKAIWRIVNGYASLPPDEPKAGMWDRRVIRAETGRFQLWPCAVYEYTYRCKLGGRQHDIAYTFFVGDKLYYLQMGTGESSWSNTYPTLYRIGESFTAL